MHHKTRIIFYTLILLFSFSILSNHSYAQTNLIPNPSLENESGGSPISWSKGRWGINAAVFSYPVPGFSGAKAAKVQLTSRTSGDAKWYFNEVTIKPNTRYVFSNSYTSNVSSWVTAQFKLSDGTYRWVDLARPGPSSGWSSVNQSFVTPSNAVSLTIFHLINQVGNLTVDNYSLTEGNSRGLLTLNFDDGWRTTHQNALPILANSGIKASFYITSRFSFPAYINESQVLEIQQQGHEVGSHTRNHVDLTTLTAAQQNTEVNGNVADLKNLGITKIETFAYPFGAYNSSTDTLLKNSGFLGARTSDGGLNNSTVSKFLLRRRSVEVNTSVSQVQAWIDQAINNNEWLVLVFHRVDASGTQYSTTPQNLQSMISYAKSKGINIVTTAEGIRRTY